MTNRFLGTQLNKIIPAAALFTLVGCAGGGGSTSVHTMGDTIDITKFQGIIEINTDAISGEIKHNSLLRLNVEENKIEELDPGPFQRLEGKGRRTRVEVEYPVCHNRTSF